MVDKLFLISKYTFKEIIKSKILYVTLLLGLAIVVMTYVATEFTYGVPEKVAQDFGLGLLSLSSVGIAIFMGATLLTKELDSRTVYMVISRPVPRWVFITGKILGLAGVLVTNIAILAIMTILCASWLGGNASGLLYLAVFFTVLECLLLLLLVVFFSLITSPILASVISLIIWLLGHAVKESQSLLFVKNRPFFKSVLEVYHIILPGFYKLNLKDYVIYQQSLQPSFVFNSFIYGLLYSVFLYLVIVLIFNNKNLD